MLTDDGPVPLDVPRDRDGTFEPQLIGKHERRFTGFDDKVIALYARGLTVREIQAFSEMYAVEVSPDLISAVTDAVVAEVTAWQSRPLEPIYPVVFFDALRVKIRDEAVVRSKAVYLALAVLPDGKRDILGSVDRADRGRQVLDEGLHRPEGAGLPGHPDRRDRRPQGHERGAGRRVPADHPADLHRPSDSPQLGVREVEGAQAAGGRAAPDLHGAQRGRGRAALDDFERAARGAGNFRRWSPRGAAPGRR